MLPVFQAGQFGRSLPSGPAGDPYFSSVVLLMNLDSDYSDQSSYAKTGTAFNSPTISTTTPKFGAGCGNFNKIKSYRFAYDTTLRFDGQFTIEFWVRFNSVSVYQYFMCRSFGQYFEMSNAGKLSFTSGVTLPKVAALSTGTWYHVAVTRDASNVIRLFVNGTKEAEGTTSVVWGDPGTTLNFNIADVPGSEAGGNGLNGDLDDIRLTKGVCRYSADFAVPTTAFPAF